MPTDPTLDPITVAAPGGAYSIVFDALERLPNHLATAGLRRGRCLVVTDEHVQRRYLAGVLAALQQSGWEGQAIVLPPGEESKSYGRLHEIYDRALSWGIDRKTPVLALGGGVVGDLAGFAAATLLRGLPFVQIPTTVIAQVDSAIGGKTGINHSAGKNLIGAFHQPALVLADVLTLDTLTDRDYASGLAEAVKHAIIADEALFGWASDHIDRLLGRDRSVLPHFIHRAVRIKASVVEEDERETGRRAILNFGHTFAHAIEKVAGYGRFTHGEAVVTGMRAATWLSHQLHPGVPRDAIDNLLSRIPVQGSLRGMNAESLRVSMFSDKKTEGGQLRLVLIDQLGHAYVREDVPMATVEEAWAYVCAL